MRNKRKREPCEGAFCPPTTGGSSSTEFVNKQTKHEWCGLDTVQGPDGETSRVNRESAQDEDVALGPAPTRGPLSPIVHLAMGACLLMYVLSVLEGALPQVCLIFCLLGGILLSTSRHYRSKPTHGIGRYKHLVKAQEVKGAGLL